MYVTRKCKSTEGSGLMDVRATRNSDIAAGLLPGRLLGGWSGSISGSYLKGCRMRGIGFIFGGLQGLFSSLPVSWRKAGMTIAGLHIRDKYKEGAVSYDRFGSVPACFRPESLPKRGYGVAYERGRFFIACNVTEGCCRACFRHRLCGRIFGRSVTEERLPFLF